MKTVIDSFRGEYRWLSNFYPYQIEYEGEEYPSVENAYQAAKTDDLQVRQLFLRISAKEAKALGKKVKMANGWEMKKLSVMRKLLRKKFAPGTELHRKLLATGNAELVEGNFWHDYFWGVCNGKGENWLGRILMELRGDTK